MRTVPRQVLSNRTSAQKTRCRVSAGVINNTSFYCTYFYIFDKKNQILEGNPMSISVPLLTTRPYSSLGPYLSLREFFANVCDVCYRSYQPCHQKMGLKSKFKSSSAQTICPHCAKELKTTSLQGHINAIHGTHEIPCTVAGCKIFIKHPGLVTYSILLCWLFIINDRYEKASFQQSHNQGLSQLFVIVSWDLRA